MPRIAGMLTIRPARRYFRETDLSGLARYLGMSSRTLGNWKRDGFLDGCQTTKGRWDSSKVWDVAETRRDMALDCGDDETDSPALERYRMARAQREELALEQDRGKLIERESVDEMLVARVQVLKRTLLNIPHALASRLAAETTAKGCREILRDRLETAIRNYAAMKEGDSDEIQA